MPFFTFSSSASPEWKNFDVMMAGTEAMVPAAGALAKEKETERAASLPRLGVVSGPVRCG